MLAGYKLQSLCDELYLLDKGVRDCFSLNVVGDKEEREEAIDQIIGKVIQYDYFVYTVELDEETTCVYVCKYNYQKVILHTIYNELTPHSILYEYCLGTLLGYSGKSMDEFLTKIMIDKTIANKVKLIQSVLMLM